jgi:phosphoenolpyruvate-protein kinase (PTS system EI component)
MPIELMGVAASPGKADGILVVAERWHDRSPANAILLSHHLTPDDFLQLLRCQAAVSIVGGFASHAAILCRELGVPAVTGVGGEDWKSWHLHRAIVDGDVGRVTILPLDQ